MTLKDNPGKNDVTAYDIVNTWEEKTIADILYAYGDERYSRRIARKIVETRQAHPISQRLNLRISLHHVFPKLLKNLARENLVRIPRQKRFRHCALR